MRVIATEGQTVDIPDDAVWVDGVALEEPYVYGKPTTPGTVFTPITIPAGQVWLMGDNRTNSGDSRFFGPQPVSRVRGRADLDVLAAKGVWRVGLEACGFDSGTPDIKFETQHLAPNKRIQLTARGSLTGTASARSCTRKCATQRAGGRAGGVAE